jgi:hypothetical protein
MAPYPRRVSSSVTGTIASNGPQGRPSSPAGRGPRNPGWRDLNRLKISFPRSATRESRRGIGARCNMACRVGRRRIVTRHERERCIGFLQIPSHSALIQDSEHGPSALPSVSVAWAWLLGTQYSSPRTARRLSGPSHPLELMIKPPRIS